MDILAQPGFPWRVRPSVAQADLAGISGTATVPGHNRRDAACIGRSQSFANVAMSLTPSSSNAVERSGK